MVNINDYWPEIEEIPRNDAEAWAEMLAHRATVFEGFLNLEIQNGTCPEARSLSTQMGQDYIRSLCFRILEEMSEAHESVAHDHFLEELIDAFNYILAVIMFDPTLFVDTEIEEILFHNSLIVYGLDLEDHYARTREGFISDIGSTTVLLGLWADTLRNRSWMNNAQSVQFIGKDATKHLLASITQTLLSYFSSWDEFWQYYIAKNRVLEFRLESRY